MEENQLILNTPRLETNRLILRQLEDTDLDDMYAYCSNEDVARFVSWDAHQSIEDTKPFLNAVLKGYKNDQPLFWGFITV